MQLGARKDLERVVLLKVAHTYGALLVAQANVTRPYGGNRVERLVGDAVVDGLLLRLEFGQVVELQLEHEREVLEEVGAARRE